LFGPSWSGRHQQLCPVTERALQASHSADLLRIHERGQRADDRVPFAYKLLFVFVLTNATTAATEE
jgi:hypothetical protein